MRARRPVLDPPHVQHRAIEVDLVPAPIADFSCPEAVAESDQDHGRVPMTIPFGPGGLDQGVDLAGRQVLAGAKLGVRSACPQCARAIGFLGSRRPVDACRRFLNGARRRNCSENFSWRDQLECLFNEIPSSELELFVLHINYEQSANMKIAVSQTVALLRSTK